MLGGVGGARPEEIGPVTEYVLRQAPCRVLLTAPPADRLARGGRRRATGRRSERARSRGVARLRAMFVLIVGVGRVGSSLARTMLKEGHKVSCLDEDPESHARLEIGLDKSWEDLGGQFTVGTALEIEALERGRDRAADAFVASTDGDNTNIIIAQIAKRRFNVPTVIARVLDPYRAKWYEKQGLHTICPTRVAIDMLARRSARLRPRARTERAEAAGRRCERRATATSRRAEWASPCT